MRGPRLCQSLDKAGDLHAYEVVTWNVDWWNKKRAGVEERLGLLRDLDSDVIALQEVKGQFVPDYEGLGPSVFGNAFKPEATHTWMLSGLVFREGTEIADAGLVPMPYRDQRVVWARAKLPGAASPVMFLSWHSQHGQGISADEKGSMFEAVSRWLTDQVGPVVAGCDINTSTDPVDLRAADPDHPYASENKFVGPDPEHRLRDAYRLYLESEGLLDDLRAKNPDGPLVVSYEKPPSRRDRIYVSDEFEVIASDYEAERGFALSDHAPHWAILEMS